MLFRSGFGNALNTQRTVRYLERAGAAAIQLEDQSFPKRCGHLDGKKLISRGEMVGKVKAALDARRSDDTLIIARTDARGAHGGTLDNAIERANAYLAAGADMAFVEGPTDVDEVKRICAEVEGPVFYNQTGISPRFSREQMTELGIAATILPGASMRVTMQAVYDFAVRLRDEGALVEQEFANQFKDHPVGDFHTFAGFDQIREWEEAYLAPEELEKYADSVGHLPKSA